MPEKHNSVLDRHAKSSQEPLASSREPAKAPEGLQELPRCGLGPADGTVAHAEALRRGAYRVGPTGVLALALFAAFTSADLVTAMVAARVVAPHTKLATTRWWQARTRSEDLRVSGASEDDLNDAMDWLLTRQKATEQKLAARHLTEGGLVLYDISSSCFEAKKRTCRSGRCWRVATAWALEAGRARSQRDLHAPGIQARDPTRRQRRIARARRGTNKAGARSGAEVQPRGHRPQAHL